MSKYDSEFGFNATKLVSKSEAIVLNNESVREGHIIEVYNKNKPKFSNANKKYYVIWVERDNTEFPIMLSERELENARYRAIKNPEDVPKKSFVNNLTD